MLLTNTDRSNLAAVQARFGVATDSDAARLALRLVSQARVTLAPADLPARRLGDTAQRTTLELADADRAAARLLQARFSLRTRSRAIRLALHLLATANLDVTLH
jgi:hypothetical protein